jgi:hypothetical protein
MQSQNWRDSILECIVPIKIIVRIFSPNVLWDCSCVRARARQHHNPHSFFVCGIHQDGICCCRPSRLVCFIGDGVPDAAGQLACAVCAASVARMPRIPCVTAAAFVFAACFCFLFFVDPDARVVGDQGHVFAQSA